MDNTPVRVKFEFLHEGAKEVLPLGFETELIPTYSDKEKIIVNEQRRHIEGKWQVVSPAVISPAGSFEGYTFKGANGHTYSDHWIFCMVGYKSIGDIFEKK